VVRKQKSPSEEDVLRLEEQPMWMSVSPPILISSVLLYSEHPAQIKEYKPYETGIKSVSIREFIFLAVHQNNCYIVPGGTK
jgi:hypothetical protein